MNRMNYYEAKFLRDAKKNPTQWIIVPNGDSTFRLAQTFVDFSENKDTRIKT